MCDTLDTDPDPVYDQSVFVDNLQLLDPVLLNNKLGDTCMGVPGRLLGKSQFYTEINASQYIIETVQEGYYKLIFTPPPKKNLRKTISLLLNLLTLFMMNFFVLRT